MFRRRRTRRTNLVKDESAQSVNTTKDSSTKPTGHEQPSTPLGTFRRAGGNLPSSETASVRCPSQNRAPHTTARLRAEENFRHIAGKLNTAMTRSVRNRQILEGIKVLELLDVDFVVVKETAESLQAAIEKSIAERTEYGRHSSWQTVKSLINSWFNALFPVIRSGANAVMVPISVSLSRFTNY